MMLLWVLVIVAVAVLIAVAVASRVGSAPQLPPTPTQTHLPPPEQAQPPPPGRATLQPPTQKRIQTRPLRAEPPEPPDGSQKNIRLRGRIRKREVTLSPNVRCRVTRRLWTECGCEHCHKLREKHGV